MGRIDNGDKNSKRDRSISARLQVSSAATRLTALPFVALTGDNIGSIERVMIDKLSGKVAYAVMSFGGFLGIGEDYYPLPWSVLTYNPTLGGYEVDLTEQQVRNAPKYSRHESWDWPRSRTNTEAHRLLWDLVRVEADAEFRKGE